MPYLIIEDDDKHCVHKRNPDGSTGERIACHPTEGEAQAQITALNIAESGKALVTVKADTSGEEWILDVLGLPYDGPYGGKDRAGERFTPDTDFMFESFPKRPIVYFHGQDGTDLKGRQAPEIIGEELSRQVKADGVWFKVRLDKTKDNALKVWESAKQGLARASSGSLPQFAKILKDGTITVWPAAELSLFDGSKKPMNPYAVAIPVMKAVYKSAGLDLPASFFDQHEDDESIEGLPPGERNGLSDNVITRKVKGKAIMDEKMKELFVQALNSILPGMADAILAEMEKLAGGVEKAEGEEEELPTEEEMKAKKDEMVKAMAEYLVKAGEKDTGLQDATEDTIDAKVKALVDARLPDAVNSAVAQQDAKRQRMTKAVADAVDRIQRNAPATPKAKAVGGFQGKQPAGMKVTDLRYAPLKASDMQFGYLAMKSRGLEHRLSPDYMKAMAFKSVEFADSDPYKRPEDNFAIKAAVANLKADEIMATNIAGQGTEFVGIQYGTTLWERARFNRILGKLLDKGMMEFDIEQGKNSAYIPLEGADPIVYGAPQANDLDATNRVESTVKPGFLGTSRVLFTPGELKAAVAETDIMSEDSLIALAPQTNKQMQEVMADHIDKLFLNGDSETAANTNINLIDGTPGTGIETPYYIISDGALKYALVTGTSTSSDLNLGGLQITDYMTLQGLLPNVVTENEDDLLYIEDPETYRKTQTLPELQTTDVAGQYATIQGGKIFGIYGVDLLKSGFMATANTAGKIPAAGAALGRILLVYPKYWGLAWKRHVTIETGRDIYAGADIFVASMRIGFKIRGAGGAVAGYNIPV